MFFEDIPKPCNIRLNLTNGALSSFYRLSVKEESFIHGKQHTKKHIDSIFHAGFTSYTNTLIKLHIERFETVIRDRSVSLGEKDLYEVAERIFDDVQLVIDGTGKVNDVLNFDDLRQEGRHNKKYLEDRYKGAGMKAIALFFDTALNNKNGLLNYLYQYSRMGLLLHIPYGFLSASFLKGDITVRHNNFMLNTCADVTEYFKLEEINTKEDVVVIAGKGETDFAYNIPAFEYEVKRLNIEQQKYERPELKEYAKKIRLNLNTGQLLDSSLDVFFSFGRSYQKRNIYELKKADAQTL